MAKYSSCAYSNAAGTAIDATIVASGARTTLGQSDPITKDDFARAKAGEYGPVAPWVTPEPSKAQLLNYAQAKAQGILSAMRTYVGPSGVGGSIKSDATSGTIAHLLALVDWGRENPSAENNWIANDGSVQVVTGAQIAAIAPTVGEYARSVYSDAMSDVLTKIGAGTISTFAQIDSYPWTV